MIPPFTIPEADKDLWDCGLSPLDLALRRQKPCRKCGDYFVPHRPHAQICSSCLDASLDANRARARARGAKKVPLTLSPRQLRAIEKVIIQNLPAGCVLAKPLDPKNGFRPEGFPFVGISVAFFTWPKFCSEDFYQKACQRAIRKALV
jgi:hypothetical protein